MTHRTLALLLLLLPSTALAEAVFYPRDELLKLSEVVAVITVKSVAPSKAKGTHWTYQQLVEVETEQVIKGKLPETFQLHAEKDFLCGRASYRPGRYLVLLRKDGELWTTVNNEQGQYEIGDDEQVEFFDDGTGYTRSDQALEQVIEAIRAREAVARTETTRLQEAPSADDD